MSQLPWITILTLLPLLGGAAILLSGNEKTPWPRRLALGVCLGVLGLAVWMAAHFDGASAAPQFEERHDWIPALAVEYRAGVDGLSVLMVLLTALLAPMAVLASWGVSRRPPLYFALMLWLQAGLLGTFTALNFFHWFLYWELSLVPAFFLIRLWGGARRGEAATQFFVYTMAGSVTLLLAFLALFLATGKFDLLELAGLGRSGALAPALARELGWSEAAARGGMLVIFGGVLLGFAVKTPMMPFHSWLPLTYAEAPTGVTMLLTGALSKMGMYGFLRILLPIFPGQTRQALTPLLWLTVAGIVISAGAALAQRDLKRVFAWSSINHLGYCLLGTFVLLRPGGGLAQPELEQSAALAGVLLQMFNHGLTAALLFWFTGLLARRAGGRRDLEDFGGLRRVAPVFCGLMGIAIFSSLGLPGLNGFISEFLIFKGVFPLAPWAAAASLAGLLLTAIFLLNLLQKVFNGPLAERWRGFPDLTWGERLATAPAIALLLVIGVYPQLFLRLVNGAVAGFVNQLRF